MTVGKIYSGLLILENYRAYKLLMANGGQGKGVKIKKNWIT